MYLFFIFMCISFLLTGCVDNRKESVELYNSNVLNTVTLYKAVEEYANKKEDGLLQYIKGEIDSYEGVTFDRDLCYNYTEEENVRIIRKIFVSSLERNTVTEILFLDVTKPLYVEIIWDINGVVNMTWRDLKWTKQSQSSL